MIMVEVVEGETENIDGAWKKALYKSVRSAPLIT